MKVKPLPLVLFSMYVVIFYLFMAEKRSNHVVEDTGMCSVREVVFMLMINAVID